MVFKNNAGVNTWKVGMFWTPCEAPCKFLFNCCCAPCGAYMQRERLMGDAPYYCCMGAFPCLCLKNPCDKVPWLCCEVLCCTICAITANRAYIQRTKGVMNDQCDNCLMYRALAHTRTEMLCSHPDISHSLYCTALPYPLHSWCTCICQWALCILQVMGQPVDPSLENAIDCFYYSQRSSTSH